MALVGYKILILSPVSASFAPKLSAPVKMLSHIGKRKKKTHVIWHLIHFLLFHCISHHTSYVYMETTIAQSNNFLL